MKFDEVKKGYKKEQVDGYIKTINEEYEKLFMEYQELESKMAEEEQDTSYNDAIASAIINAELSAKQIVIKAQSEARRIGIEAKRELEEARHERDLAIEEIKQLSQRLQGILMDKELVTGREN